MTDNDHAPPERKSSKAIPAPAPAAIVETKAVAPKAPAAPTLGRIVHYKSQAHLHAALVTHVHEDGSVNLAVYPITGAAPQGAQRVHRGTGVGEWAWPEMK